MKHLLLADDDIELCQLLKEYLESEGFTVSCVHDGAAAVENCLNGDYDLMVLDVMMPKLSGFEALQKTRQHSQIPVLMLTARGDDIDRIIGLEMGADDYLPKPCNPRELVARIRAILRRLTPTTTSNGPLKIDDIELQPTTRRAFCSDQELNLTGAEFNVLSELLKRPGQVVSKAELTELVLGRKLTPHDRSMDMHISHLRKKLGHHPDGDHRIKTVRGNGYLYSKKAD